MEWVYILQIGVNHLLWGFSLSMLALWIIKALSEDLAADILKTYLQSCMQLVGILGLAFFLIWLIDQVYFTVVGAQHGKSISLYNLFDTTYWPMTLIPAIGPVFILALSQSLWWRQNSSKRWLRVALALAIPFGIFEEGLPNLIFSLHRDFLVSSGSMFFPTGFLELAIIGLMAFSTTVWGAHKLKSLSV